MNDPLNYGAILRTAYAFGIKNILLLNQYMPEENAYIASMASGALEKVNLIKISNLISVIKKLKKENWWILGLESKDLENCENIRNKNIKYDKTALVIGSENEGLRKLVRLNCDVLVRISMNSKIVDSLNVVQATSIALHEICNK